jgi:hypothetical protein
MYLPHLPQLLMCLLPHVFLIMLLSQALKSRAADSSAAGRELAGAGADGLRYQDYTHHTPSSHVGEQPSVVSGQTQFGGQNFSGTHASMHWGVKDIPTPKEMVGALDDWVVGQPAAKRVSSSRMLVVLQQDVVGRLQQWQQLLLDRCWQQQQQQQHISGKCEALFSNSQHCNMATPRCTCCICQQRTARVVC